MKKVLSRGTKSLLFGVHQFLWHPITVELAWRALYGRPSTRESICIFIHDWGYWGKRYMDDAEGETHPELAAKLALWLLGSEYSDLCLFHSRHYARAAGRQPSKLCWADKFSIVFDPWWFYIPRAMLSGEIGEYRDLAEPFFCPAKSHREWFIWIRRKFIKLACSEAADAMPYMNKEKA